MESTLREYKFGGFCRQHLTTSLSEAPRGDRSAMRPFTELLWTLVIIRRLLSRPLFWVANVLTDEWNGERRSRNGVGDHEQEDGERQQNGDAERDLLAGVGRQAEADHDEDGQHDARQDDVHYVELVATLEVEREDDVCVALARLVFLTAVPFTNTVATRCVAKPSVSPLGADAPAKLRDRGVIGGVKCASMLRSSHPLRNASAQNEAWVY